MDFLVADAASEHIDAIEELEKQCFSVPWTREQLLSQLPDGRHEFLVALCEGQPVGYVGMMCVLDEGYIANVAVSKDYRRRGIADGLIAELLRRAVDRQLAFVTLEVRAGNEAAKALYAKHSFVPVGTRKNYYASPREDAVLMTNFLK